MYVAHFRCQTKHCRHCKSHKVATCAHNLFCGRHLLQSIAIFCNLLQSEHQHINCPAPNFPHLHSVCSVLPRIYCAKILQDLPPLKILQLNILPCKSHKTHIHWISKFSRSSQKCSHSGRTPENSLVDSFPIQCTSLSLQLGCTLLT